VKEQHNSSPRHSIQPRTGCNPQLLRLCRQLCFCSWLTAPAGCLS